MVIAVLFGVFVAVFLLYFEPFDLNLSKNQNKTFQLIFYGCISTFVLSIFLYLFPLLFSDFFSDKHWTVLHQIVFYFIILFIIATFNGLYTNYINTLPFSWANYWWIINRTFVLGGIPIAFLTLLDLQRKEEVNSNKASSILHTQKEVKRNSKNIFHEVTTDLKYEILSFSEDNFNYAMADGNYTDIYSLSENILKKTTYRITLSSFEVQLKNSSSLKRCHRSYLVNLKKVTNISGNAQGLKLELENQSEIIPVSRKYIPSVKQFF